MVSLFLCSQQHQETKTLHIQTGNSISLFSIILLSNHHSHLRLSSTTASTSVPMFLPPIHSSAPPKSHICHPGCLPGIILSLFSQVQGLQCGNNCYIVGLAICRQIWFDCICLGHTLLISALMSGVKQYLGTMPQLTVLIKLQKCVLGCRGCWEFLTIWKASYNSLFSC